MFPCPPACWARVMTVGTFLTLLSGTPRQLNIWVELMFDDVLFDTLNLAEFPVPSLSRCLLSCSQDARCVSVFYQESRGQCRLQGGRFYLAQGGREEQGWRYYLLEMDPRCPARTGYIHRRDLNLCYRLEFQVAASRAEAISNCTAEGGHLLRIDSQEEQNHVEEQLNSSNGTAVYYAKGSTNRQGYYVDGQRINGLWVWPYNNQPIAYSNWYDGENTALYPNQEFIIFGGPEKWKWISVGGSLGRSYICEIQI